MRLAEIAWKEVDASTLRNCWKKTGILPQSALTSNVPAVVAVPVSSLVNSTPNDPVESAEKLVEQSLDILEATGALQKVNRMAIDTLLNPDGERRYINEKKTEEELMEDICDSVLEARDALQNSTLDNDHDDEEIVEPPPSRRQALEAVSTLTRYISTIDDEFARKLESLLGSFSRQTRLEDIRAQHDTQITDYFQRST
ncbi:hypothetical protein D9758_017665 [Tetrapyrgos nigripes]|uniref:Uncharacterized protein n=1 Tax=Tetrapyrgos nigripes TaxID=182062 RepID=A0A8H5C2N0_9AGAR|nr:hypothetical protein D9758_017665 [Tetrapyrgos nigripes]